MKFREKILEQANALKPGESFEVPRKESAYNNVWRILKGKGFTLSYLPSDKKKYVATVVTRKRALYMSVELCANTMEAAWLGDKLMRPEVEMSLPEYVLEKAKERVRSESETPVEFFNITIERNIEIHPHTFRVKGDVVIKAN